MFFPHEAPLSSVKSIHTSWDTTHSERRPRMTPSLPRARGDASWPAAETGCLGSTWPWRTWQRCRPAGRSLSSHFPGYPSSPGCPSPGSRPWGRMVSSAPFLCRESIRLKPSEAGHWHKRLLTNSLNTDQWLCTHPPTHTHTHTHTHM